MDAGHNWQANWQITGRTRQTLRYRAKKYGLTMPQAEGDD